jgi:hypothetical protein
MHPRQLSHAVRGSDPLIHEVSEGAISGTAAPRSKYRLLLA